MKSRCSGTVHEVQVRVASGQGAKREEGFDCSELQIPEEGVAKRERKSAFTAPSMTVLSMLA